MCIDKGIYTADSVLGRIQLYSPAGHHTQSNHPKLLFYCRRYGSPWVCINKCIYTAELVLGRRTAATALGFAAKLVALAEPADEQEVQKYYSDPGSMTDR